MPVKISKAMVLAAGFGLRMRPLTLALPKPLVPVAGKPMIRHALDKLQEHGIRDVVVNVSHLKAQLLSYLGSLQSWNIQCSEEDEPLETGGGLKHALPLLGDKAFFAINSDIIWTDPNSHETALNRLDRFWDESKMDFLLLAQPRQSALGYETGQDHLFVQSSNTFEWDDKNAPYIMAGLYVIHPRVFRNAPDGKFSLKILWLEAMRQNRLFCVPHCGRWCQAGTVKDITLAETMLLHPPV